MPTPEELKRERDSKQRLFDQASKVADNTSGSLKQAQVDLGKAISDGKEKGQKAANAALEAAANDNLDQGQKDAAIEGARGSLEQIGKNIDKAAGNVKAAADANKAAQKDLDSAKKDLEKANSDYQAEQAKLAAQAAIDAQAETDAEQEKQDKDKEKQAGDIDAQLEQFKKSGTGLTGFNPEEWCQKITLVCDECSMFYASAKQACTTYSNAKIEYEKSKKNTLEVTQKEKTKQEELSATIRDVSNQIDGYNKTISAGISVLKDMARDGSTQAQKDGLSRNIQEQQSKVDDLKRGIAAVEAAIGKSEKAISDAKQAENKAQGNIILTKDNARVALAQLASCNLKCQSVTIKNSSKTGPTDGGKTGPQGSVEMGGGSTGTAGSTGVTGLSGGTSNASSGAMGTSTQDTTGTWYWVRGGTSGLAYWDAASKAAWEEAKVDISTAPKLVQTASVIEGNPSILSNLSGG